MDAEKGMTWLSAWAQRTAAALWAWLCQRVAAFTDWCLDYALARIGEPMEWRDVERFARARAEEEERTMGERLREWDEIMEGSRRIRGEVATAGLRAFAKRVDEEIMAMDGHPRIRLLSKP